MVYRQLITAAITEPAILFIPVAARKTSAASCISGVSACDFPPSGEMALVGSTDYSSSGSPSRGWLVEVVATDACR